MPPTPISKLARTRAKEQRALDLAALAAVQAGRPLAPPPCTFPERRRNSAAAEARKDRERGFGL